MKSHRATSTTRVVAEALPPSEERRDDGGRARAVEQIAPDIVERSVAMQATCERIRRIASRDLPVMLCGEPGSGKTLIARAIHARSERAARAFVKIHCAAIADTALDTGLFEGSTGAVSASAVDTYVARADRGTLFLDEITELGPMAQDRLLTILESSSRDGDPAADVRFISWSSRSLDEAVAHGRFRRDLFEHLSAVTIDVPPLRDRRADLPRLVEVLLDRFAREHARRVDRLSRRASEMVMNYDWPGNVRELSDAIERAVVVTGGPVIHPNHLPQAVQAAWKSAAPVGLAEALEAYEKELLQDALRRSGGVRAKAARLLQTTERIFNYRVRKHGIDSRQFKGSR